MLDNIHQMEGPSADILQEVGAELRAARVELTEFAQGIHPLALTEGGLSAALPALAERVGVPVQLTVARIACREPSKQPCTFCALRP